jgi:hypothetical protein
MASSITVAQPVPGEKQGQIHEKGGKEHFKAPWGSVNGLGLANLENRNDYPIL